jgi:hypothetical protein
VNPVKVDTNNGVVKITLGGKSYSFVVPLVPLGATSGTFFVNVGTGKVAIDFSQSGDGKGVNITGATATGMTGLGASEIKVSINGNNYPVTFSSGEFRGLGGTLQLNGVFRDTLKVTAIYKFPDGKTLVEIGADGNGPKMKLTVPTDFTIGGGKGKFTLTLENGGKVTGTLSVVQGGFTFSLVGTNGEPVKFIAEVAAKMFGGNFKSALTNRNSNGQPEFSLTYNTAKNNDAEASIGFSATGTDVQFRIAAKIFF